MPRLAFSIFSIFSIFANRANGQPGSGGPSNELPQPSLGLDFETLPLVNCNHASTLSPIAQGAETLTTDAYVGNQALVLDGNSSGVRFQTGTAESWTIGFWIKYEYNESPFVPRRGYILDGREMDDKCTYILIDDDQTLRMRVGSPEVPLVDEFSFLPKVGVWEFWTFTSDRAKQKSFVYREGQNVRCVSSIGHSPSGPNRHSHRSRSPRPLCQDHRGLLVHQYSGNVRSIPRQL